MQKQNNFNHVFTFLRRSIVHLQKCFSLLGMVSSPFHIISKALSVQVNVFFLDFILYFILFFLNVLSFYQWYSLSFLPIPQTSLRTLILVSEVFILSLSDILSFLKTLWHNGNKESCTLIESYRTHDLYWITSGFLFVQWC